MSNTYRIHGARFLRKYTAAEKSSNFAYMADVRKIADTLCKVPWDRVSADVAATNTIHTEEGLDWNAPERERFDAAEWCAEHSDGFHRAYAQAACYVFKLPDSAVGKAIEKIRVNVTSDPYNPYGARIAAMTSATLDIPMDCATVREGEVFRAPDEDGMGAAPRLFRNNADGTQTWYSNSEIVDLEPGETLTAKRYLFVFVCLENYNRGRDGWIEGSSYIDNDVELTLSAAASDLSDDELNDLTPPVVFSEFKVCRGGVLPRLVGECSGVQEVETSFNGDVEFGRFGRFGLDESSSIGLRVAYGLFFKGEANQLQTSEYGLGSSIRPGAAFSVSCSGIDSSVMKQSNKNSGSWRAIVYGNGVFVAGSIGGVGILYSTDYGRTWTQSDNTDGKWYSAAYGNGVFVVGSYDGNGIIYSTDYGRTWNQSGQSSEAFGSIAYGNGVFVAVNPVNSGIFYSTDYGMTWDHSDQVSGSFTSVAYGNGVFVAAGGDEEMWYSTDYGRTWTQSEQTNERFKSLAYGNGVFVAGCASSSAGTGLWYSTDYGRTWSRSGQTTGRWDSVAFVNNMFMASSLLTGGLLYSTDRGMTWSNSGAGSGLFTSLTPGEGEVIAGGDETGIWYLDTIKSKWKIMSSVLFVRTSVPMEFKASKVRVDWTDWGGVATSGARFNVWLKRGGFAAEYDADVIKNHVIYDAESDTAGDYELVGTIDATLASRTATLDLKRPLDCGVATFLLSAYVSMDHVNPSSLMQLPVGAAASQYVDMAGKRVLNVETGWRPDITLLG